MDYKTIRRLELLIHDAEEKIKDAQLIISDLKAADEFGPRQVVARTSYEDTTRRERPRRHEALWDRGGGPSVGSAKPSRIGRHKRTFGNKSGRHQR